MRADARTRPARDDRDAVRRPRLLLAARAAAPFQPGRHAGGDQLLRHRSRCGDARASWSTSTSSTHGAVRLSVGAVNVRTGNFGLLRQPDDADRRAPRHGERRAAAGLSAGRDRRRVLLGRRPRLEHAAAVRARRSPATNALVFQVDLFAARGEMPANLAEVQRAREGHPLLEPDAAEHRPDQASWQATAQARAPAARQAAAQRCATIPTRSRWPRCRCRGAVVVVHLIYRSKHYESQLEGLRVLARLDARALGRRPRRHARATLEDPRWLAREPPRRRRARVRPDVGGPLRPRPSLHHRFTSRSRMSKLQGQDRHRHRRRQRHRQGNRRSLYAREGAKVAIADLNLAGRRGRGRRDQGRRRQGDRRRRWT